MSNKIQKILKKEEMKLMTHIVAGYPDFTKSYDLVKVMNDKGVDLLEIQIPFSDPLADGPVIQVANSRALKKKDYSLDKVFDFIDKITNDFEIPVIVVAYFNTVVNVGVEKFCKKLKKIGISGVIIPDYNIDNENKERLLANCKKNNISYIPIISPVSTKERMEKMDEIADSFIYCAARLGITGDKTTLSKELSDYLKRVKEMVSKSISLGFGIQGKEQIDLLKNSIYTPDIVVIGSAVIKILDEDGIDGVGNFLNNL